MSAKTSTLPTTLQALPARDQAAARTATPARMLTLPIALAVMWLFPIGWALFTALRLNSARPSGYFCIGGFNSRQLRQRVGTG